MNCITHLKYSRDVFFSIQNIQLWIWGLLWCAHDFQESIRCIRDFCAQGYAWKNSVFRHLHRWPCSMLTTPLNKLTIQQVSSQRHMSKAIWTTEKYRSARFGSTVHEIRLNNATACTLGSCPNMCLQAINQNVPWATRTLIWHCFKAHNSWDKSVIIIVCYATRNRWVLLVYNIATVPRKCSG